MLLDVGAWQGPRVTSRLRRLACVLLLDAGTWPACSPQARLLGLHVIFGRGLLAEDMRVVSRSLLAEGMCVVFKRDPLTKGVHFVSCGLR